MVTGAVAILNTNATVGLLILDGTTYTSGTFSSTTHPAFFQGTGILTVSLANGIQSPSTKKALCFYDGKTLFMNPEMDRIQLFNLLGKEIVNQKVTAGSLSLSLPAGVYVVRMAGQGAEIKTKLIVN